MTDNSGIDEVSSRSPLDPRLGDAEDDASSTENRSILALTGSLLSEISFPRLAAATLVLIVLPALLLGITPPLVSAWVMTISGTIRSPTLEVWPILLLVVSIGAALISGRRLFRLAESSFWSLNALTIQPSYVACRETLRHTTELLLSEKATAMQRAKLRSVTAVVAGFILCGLSVGALLLAWPGSKLVLSPGDMTSLDRLMVIAFSNSVVLITSYLAVAAFVWGLADATTPQPYDITDFEPQSVPGRAWRIAHLSDLHVVGERYGFRIESGRAGPQGNARYEKLLNELGKLDADDPLDTILVTGDMTDAGRSTEWAEFERALFSYPALASKTLMIPGNHDVNIVDRANPSRFDLPTSPGKNLRKIRVLSSINRLQGQRVHVMDRSNGRLGGNLAELMDVHASWMAKFATSGRPKPSAAQAEVWERAFPMILPPDTPDGLGVILVNTNADSHFSFTNALGIVSAEQVKAITALAEIYPDACWVIALHHHLVEYPRKAKALSERIGTALINGTWLIRMLQPLAGRAIVMHGHRHIDWIGGCLGLLMVSAPSPVMGATNDASTHFYVHTLYRNRDRRLQLCSPRRIVLTPCSHDPGQPLTEKHSAMPGRLSSFKRDGEST